MTIETSASLIWTNKYVISVLLFILVFTYISFIAKWKKKNNFPPGPKVLPIVGFWPFLTQFKYKDFMELGKIYGDIIGVRLGWQDYVIMHGGDAVIESLNNPLVFGRPSNFQHNNLRPITIFVGHDLKSWKEHRRLLFHSMKDLGVGKTKLEHDIIDEISHFMNFIRSYKAQPINVEKGLFSSLTNNMFSFVFGKRFAYDSSILKLMYDKIEKLFEHNVPVPLEMAFPWLRYIPLTSKFLQDPKMRALNKSCDIFYRKEILRHEETFDSGHARDLVDRYLIEIATKDKNQETSFNRNMLLCLVRDLFNASIETTQTSLLWFIYILAAFPEVQKKVQREIMNVIGSEKIPELNDMKNMPYTHAFLMETMRWKTVAPLSVPHYALDDFKVHGYIIPKDTVVLHNLWAVHHDRRYWDEPEKFKPERFLSSDGKFVVKSKYFMPFSKGGRGCPGESIAILEIFLYCTSILKEFNILFPDGTKPTFKAKCTMVYRLEPYLVRFIPKN